MAIQPEDAKAAGPFIAGFATFMATLWAIFSHAKRRQEIMDARFDMKANQSDMQKCLKHIETLYQNAEQDRKQTRDLHDSAMIRISSSTEQILHALRKP